MTKIKIKRVYDPPSPSDGKRVLVDRLWPRGLTKEAAIVDYWAKQASPSSELRKWYQHDHTKWEEFKKRYYAELEASPNAVAELMAELTDGSVTFVFGSKENRLNNAAALKQYIELIKK